MEKTGRKLDLHRIWRRGEEKYGKIKTGGFDEQKARRPSNYGE
jgi:hypothetical protein